ncbi:MAG TPA: hypothetical protein VMS43_14350 [Allosphingosinicella sp.]|nr:hypothetical protein [Allosphingosinicella sp.]
MADIARLYDSLSARPGWPASGNEAEVDAELARRGLRPEQRRSIIAMMRQDVCRLPETAPACRYYGAETIYKVQRLGWARRGREAGPDTDVTMQQMRLLEYGASRNLARLYGEAGLTEARETELNNAGRGAARASAAAGFSQQFSQWFTCAANEQSLPILQTGTWPRYRLTTCGWGLGSYTAIAIFNWKWSVEVDVLFTHSRFARFVGFWWLTGAEPTICANSIIDGYGNYTCNSYRWYSPVSFNTRITLNSNPVSVVSTGSGMRLNYSFGVTIVHQ